MADEGTRELVVVAGNEDHPRALADLAQQLLDDVVVGLRPVPVALELPAVDDVADQEQVLALDVLQERQQLRCLTAGRAEMKIGDPDAANAKPETVGVAGVRLGMRVVGSGRSGQYLFPRAEDGRIAMHR